MPMKKVKEENEPYNNSGKEIWQTYDSGIIFDLYPKSTCKVLVKTAGFYSEHAKDIHFDSILYLFLHKKNIG